jgi:hypothetical protein
MPNLNVVHLGKLCRRLASHAMVYAERIARAATEPFSDRLPAGRPFVDLCEYQLFLGENLKALYAEVVELDDLCAHQRSVCRQLRERRDHLTRVLREHFLSVTRALTGSYCGDAMRLLSKQFSPAPANPRELLSMVERFCALLADPELELPPPQPGVEVDLEEVARSFESPARLLGENLTELLENEAVARLTQSQRSAALERLRSLAGKVARFYEALADVADETRIAGRLSRSQHTVS